MKWNSDDVDVFRKERDYVDTVLIPLVPIEWGDSMNRTVVEGRFTTVLGEETERQLKGRVLLSPPFTYLKSKTWIDKNRDLEVWLQEVKMSGVKYVVCLSADLDWNHLDFEDQDKVHFIWLPALPLDHMDPKHKQDYLDENVGQIMKRMTQAWTENS